MLDKEKKHNLSIVKKQLENIEEINFSLQEKFIFIQNSLEQVLQISTQGINVQFASYSARIIFLAQSFDIPQQLIFEVQNLKRTKKIDNSAFDKYLRILNLLIDCLCGIPFQIEEKYIQKDYKSASSYIRVSVREINLAQSYISCLTLDAEREFIIECKLEEENDPLSSIIHNLWVGAELNLIDYTIKENVIVPKFIILEPDYLVDASKIGECFQNYGYSPLFYLLSKFEIIQPSKYLLLGNLANFILDEFIYTDKELDFNDIFLRSFQQMPLEYTTCKDLEKPADFKEFMSNAKNHFENIKFVVNNDLKNLGFQKEECILEPSFYSEKYGFQGRLDLLQQSEKDTTRIIELKSGKPPYPQTNPSKVAINHEAQIAVYRLMIESVYDLDFKQISSWALYSAAKKGENLRYVTLNLSFFRNLLNMRNGIIANEFTLYSSNKDELNSFIHKLFDVENYKSSNPPNFFLERLDKMFKIYQNASLLEKSYFLRFISFVTRELYIGKLGDSDSDKCISLAALWNTNFEDRKANLELISELKISSIEEETTGMCINFRAESDSNIANTNFREGEICVIYPQQQSSKKIAILSNQILKGTIIYIGNDEIKVRFRYKQKNTNYLNKNCLWVIEHDKLDHTTNAMYHSLFSFLSANRRKKNLLLGLEAPKSKFQNCSSPRITMEQQKSYIIDKALKAEDYFLIVGPPGTGKTSQFAKSLIEQTYYHTNDNILVIAYTNRAVDELCEAILNACKQTENEQAPFIRIGSSNNCKTEFEPYLLSRISEKSKNRQELTLKLNQTRIYVGTLASIVGKPELFTFKKFQLAIIDEASQILEPQIVGLLPLVDKFILIGDHKQLSTISLQNDEHSAVVEKELNDINLFSCKESIFERLYRTVVEKQWNHAYDTLYYHGRMHESIASLINDPFYDGILKTIEQRQTQTLTFDASKYREDSLESEISKERVIFFHTQNKDSISNKINKPEAKIVVDLTEAILNIYENENRSFDPDKTLGIIAPYRNQIATIRTILRERNIPYAEKIMIDTVERYQGSQRDIIIVSFCFNNLYQMNAFMNLNKDQTVDRKLNVALSRAREQLFLVGNKYLLKQNKIYADILSHLVHL